uniref:Uncharacterized protein n=1 Tax=Cacopsylla melanoneura TaxID=428564 RepID=A0A8D8Q558_9HEMI
MFNFIKKTSSSGLATGVDREEKERRKKEKKERKEREKKERGHGGEDILRIDDVRRSLKLRSRRKDKEKLPSGITADYSAQFLSEYDREQGNSHHTGHEGRGGGASDSSENSLSSMSTSHTSHASTTHSMVTVDGKVLPPLPPRPPKRGILKGPKINVVNEDLTDDNGVLLHNTRQNELITYSNLPNIKHTSRVFIGNESARLLAQKNGDMDNHHPAASSVESLTTEDSSSFLTPPFSTSPVGEGQGFHSRFLSTQGLGFGSSTEDLTPDLPLPSVPPPPLPAPRQLTIHRQAGRSDFGFSLRRAMIVERSGSSGSFCLKPVICIRWTWRKQ